MAIKKYRSENLKIQRWLRLSRNLPKGKLMKRLVIFFLLAISVPISMALFVVQEHDIAAAAAGDNQSPQQGYKGSSICRACHERFYQLWAPSHHGLAMQPYTAEMAKNNLQPQKKAIRIGKTSYLAETGSKQGWVRELSARGEKKYPIAHVLGGKNVYYFLTTMEKGRLQVLPVAYNVHRAEWFDTVASGVRHFPGHGSSEQVDWKDPLYTFNTSCHGCHVSQLSTNYDLKTDTYRTEWTEPGINCETCHGPGQEHVKVCQAAPEGQTPKDLKIIITNTFTTDQTNSMCASCHAKMNNVSSSFKPGDRYYDHFDLVTLEHPDFYPDGRDLGENYTYTSWRMSPCVKSGKLDCVHCHTSSGRYRFEDSAKANNACLPCHQNEVKEAVSHSHHPEGSEGTTCIACHMPMSRFAHMNRSDHSMRPPVPAATMAFKSPNACNMCHKDKDAEWSDKYVRKWYKSDFQKPVLDVAHLVDAARKQDWTNLDRVLQYIMGKDRDEVITASFIRLLRSCDSQDKWPGIIKALKEDPSPLVRAAAAEALDGYLTGQSLGTLLGATRDEYRLVRVRAAASLAGIPPERLRDEYQKDLQKATAEYLESLQARADDYINHYNLGNFYMGRREHQAAISSYQTAIKLRPDFLPLYVNVAFAYNATGRNDKAEASFRSAIKLDPNNVPTYLNLGMLLGEQKRTRDAEQAFRKVLELDPNSAVAAYNLGVILAPEQPAEAVRWCGKAYKLRSDEPKYGYTYAFYLYQNAKQAAAIDVLQSMVKLQVPYSDAYAFLGSIYLKQEEFGKALDVYKAAVKNEKLPQSDRRSFEATIKRLQQY